MSQPGFKDGRNPGLPHAGSDPTPETVSTQRGVPYQGHDVDDASGVAVADAGPNSSPTARGGNSGSGGDRDRKGQPTGEEPKDDYPPRTAQHALDIAYRNAVTEALKNQTIKRLEEDLNNLDSRVLKRRSLRQLLDVNRRQMIASVDEQQNALIQLYNLRTRLTTARTKSAQNLRTGDIAEFEKALEHRPEWRKLTEEIISAIENLTSTLIDHVLVPALRRRLEEEKQAVRDRQRRAYPTELEDIDAAALADKSKFTTTSSIDSVVRLLRRMPSGSVGIAGSRGSGKTSLLENLGKALEGAGRLQDAPEQTQYSVFTVVVSAPVKYVPRDFLALLHKAICIRWLVVNKRDPEYKGHPGEAARIIWKLATAGLPILLVAIALWLIGSHVIEFPSQTLPMAIPLLVMLMASATASMLGHVNARMVLSERDYLDRSAPDSVDADGRSDTPVDAVDIHVAGRYGLLAVSLFLLLMAAFLALAHARGGFDWLTSRRALGVLLLAVSISVLPLWRGKEDDWGSQSAVSNVIARRTAICALGASGIQGFGLLLAPDLYVLTWSLAVGSGLMAAALYLASFWQSQPVGDTVALQLTPSEVEAYKGLRRIGFRRTETIGWSGALKLGAASAFPGVESSVTGSTADQEIELSAPDIVGMTRDLLSEIRKSLEKSSGLKPHKVKLIIGIDELDKLEGDEGAAAFINEIKSLFEIDSALFVVSVSEEAMASFERRGLAFRDVFDSAFSEIAHLPVRTLDESNGLLAERASGIALPFVALAHCLSAGLPRDVLREVEHMTETRYDKGLATVAGYVVHREMRGKWEGVLAAIRPIPVEPQVTDVVKALRLIDRCSGTTQARHWPRAYSDPERCLLRPDSFQAVHRLRLPLPVDAEWGHFRTLQRLAGEYISVAYFAKTLIEFFDPSSRFRDPRVDPSHPEPVDEVSWFSAFEAAEKADRVDRWSVEYLAGARRHLGVNPHLAWEQISFFRERYGLKVMPFPNGLLGTDRGQDDARVLLGSRPPSGRRIAVPTGRQRRASPGSPGSRA